MGLGLCLQNGDNRSLVAVKPRIGDESMDKSRIWKLTEITEPSQCRAIRLPDTTSSAMRVLTIFILNYISTLVCTSSKRRIIINDFNYLYRFQG